VSLLYLPIPHPEAEALQSKVKDKFDYTVKRVQAMFNMEKHKNDDSYQTYQSLVAIGSGGIAGMGLAQGTQKYGYLPLSYNDFVGAIIGEEMGFVGLCSIILAYAALVIFGFRIALECKEVGGYLIAIGVTSLIVLHALIHLGVISNTLPNTGLNLPFISYGGSNLLMNFFGIAVLMSISKSIGRKQKSSMRAMMKGKIKR